MRILSVALGAALIVSAIADASRTLVTTRRGNRRFTASQIFYRRSWRLWIELGARISNPTARQAFLGSFGPLSLLGLLVAWVSVLVVGWAFVWWGLRTEFNDVDTLFDAIYYSGITFFTVGYGDIVPVSSTGRLLAVVEAFLGLGIVALVIGYLPTLYGAYSRREVQLGLLDDLTDRVTATGLIESTYRRGGLERLYATFAEWERWCADVYDTHTAYPMLMLFRSRQPGQSWLTALGLVADAAAQAIAVIPGAEQREPALLYRRAIRTLDALAVVEAHVHGPRRLPRLDLVPDDDSTFRGSYDRLVAAGIAARPYEAARADISAFRRRYGVTLGAFATILLVEPEFHTNALPVRPDTSVAQPRNG